MNTAAGSIMVTTARELKTELEKAASAIIVVAEDIVITQPIYPKESHILTIRQGKTLAVSGGGISYYGTEGLTLTINGGGTFVSQRQLEDALSLPNAVLNLENITINLRNTSANGISAKNLNIGDQAVVRLNSETGSQMLYLHSGDTLNVNRGGKLHIEKFHNIGVSLYGTLHVNGGEVIVEKGAGWNSGLECVGGIALSSGKLRGAMGGALVLVKGANIEGMKGILHDRGASFAASGPVTVNESDGEPSSEGLSEGVYFWNDTNAFTRHVITISSQPENLTLTASAISASLSAEGAAGNDKAVSYQWYELSEKGYIQEKISGAAGSVFSLPASLTEGTHYYACSLEADQCEPKWSAMAAVTVNSPQGGTQRQFRRRRSRRQFRQQRFRR